MYKKILFTIVVAMIYLNTAAQHYQPTAENIVKRKSFQDNKYGIFIHWGASSVLGAGEWVMNNSGKTVNKYTNLFQFFNSQQLNAAE